MTSMVIHGHIRTLFLFRNLFLRYILFNQRYILLIFMDNSFERGIVLFKSLRNCKRNFMLKLMLCGGGGQHYLVLNMILT